MLPIYFFLHQVIYYIEKGYGVCARKIINYHLDKSNQKTYKHGKIFFFKFTQITLQKAGTESCHHTGVFTRSWPTCHTPRRLATYITHCLHFWHCDFCDNQIQEVNLLSTLLSATLFTIQEIKLNRGLKPPFERLFLLNDCSLKGHHP